MELQGDLELQAAEVCGFLLIQKEPWKLRSWEVRENTIRGTENAQALELRSLNTISVCKVLTKVAEASHASLNASLLNFPNTTKSY